MTFPAIVPSARVYVPGEVPAQLQISMAGNFNAYRFGNRRVGQSLQLTFSNISEADLNLIRSHYITQNGTYDIFYLPPETWSGYATVPVPSPSNVAWRYAEPPVITDGSCDLWSIEVALESYVIDSGDLSIEIPDAGATPPAVVDYIYDGGSAAALPARDYLIDSGAAR